MQCLPCSHKLVGNQPVWPIIRNQFGRLMKEKLKSKLASATEH